MSDNENKNNESSELEKFIDGTLFSKMAQGGAAKLRSNAEEVNNLNVFPVPDGDTGDNMSMTIESGVAALKNINSTNLSEVMAALSRGMLLGARGNSGVILSQFFAGMAKGFENCETADARTVVAALQEGVQRAYDSVLSPMEGTILTVAREAVEYAASIVTDETTVKNLFADLVVEMTASLQRTPELLFALKEAGVVDSGGAGLLHIMQGFSSVLNGEEIEEPEHAAAAAAPAKAIDLSAFNENSEMTYGYCTELLLQLQNSKTDAQAFDVNIITDFLKTLGDSIVSFKTGTIVKLHVHTKTPEKVLEFCRQYGEFLTVKIENMSVQHSEILTQESEDAGSDSPADLDDTAEYRASEKAPVSGDQDKKKYGIISVCSGDGIADVFREVGTDYVVNGGQTNNPSAQDFLDAFAKVHAEHIFVLPNNGNIVMAAKQAASIYEDAVVHVIENKDLGSGYTSISCADLDADDPAEVEASFYEAIQNVITGSISPAIRDANINGVTIHNGDYTGFIGKKMLVSCPDIKDAAFGLLDNLLGDGEKFMLTAFSGKDTDKDTVDAVEAYVSEKYPDVEKYIVDGGQDIYSFIFVVE